MPRVLKLNDFIMLNENRDFRRIYNRGKSFVSPALVVYYTKNRAGFCRLGITTSKKIGCAVKRNRAKRVIKEAFRKCVGNVNAGYDFVIVARTKTAYIKSTEAESVLLKLFEKAGILKNEADND
ncbi:MAG: ribonuclease P protein component [Clostridia bacterium]|nr:ribonuclease P protein component [Clostridia bacterium]